MADRPEDVYASRAYAAQRIRAGVYAQLSNDGSRIFWVHQYDEDGSALTGDGKRITGKFWAVAETSRAVVDAVLAGETEVWDAIGDSRTVAQSFRTKRAAIIDVLEYATWRGDDE